MSVQVRPLGPGQETHWSTYVDRNPEGTLFHGLQWRDLLRATFKHQTDYLLAWRDERVVGSLPLVVIKSMFFGRSVVSVPFGVYGGILADDAEATLALIEGARSTASEVGADYVELRQKVASPGLALPGTDLYATFERELPATEDECLEMLPRKARAEARKALANPEVSAEVGPLKLDEFYNLFAENKRKLGSPVFPKSLFYNLMQIYGEKLVALTVRRSGEPYSSVINFLFRDTYMAYYSGAVDEANRISANNLMYHAAMKDAVARGMRRFDFGRSRKDTGAFAFKKNQGFEPAQLAYQYVLKEGAALPSINASNPRYDFAKKVFRKLPRFVAEKVGSFVAKRMPV